VVLWNRRELTRIQNERSNPSPEDYAADEFLEEEII